ncbi:MAG: hypothetical protein V4657_02955, partial [Pseudomonadota bacterium]
MPALSEMSEHMAFTANRARLCLKLFFDPDMDNSDRAEMLDNFAKALSGYPRWAVSRGFDDWERTMQRRPSPAEIGILAGRAIRPITDEISRRKAEAEPVETEAPPCVTAEAAAEIMARAGFTPQRIAAVKSAPMALTFAEAETKAATPPRPHWSQTAAPDDPAWEQLRRSRAANP